MSRPIDLRKSEIDTAFRDESAKGIPSPTVTVKEAAELLKVSIKTIYFWIQLGRFDGCFRKRGKHIRFWRNRLIEHFFNGPDWQSAKQ